MNPLLLLSSVRMEKQASCIDTTVYSNTVKQTAVD